MLERIEARPLQWEVREIGVQVAALMTADLIRRPPRRVPRGFDFVIVPGRCRGDLEALSPHYGLPVRRGPEELKDLPRYFKELQPST
jgi:hypothetical protein